TPRSAHSACRASRAWPMLPSGAGSSSVNSALSCATVSGWLLASRAASTMRLISCGSMRVLWRDGVASTRAGVVRVGVDVVVELAGELERGVGRTVDGQRLDV